MRPGSASFRKESTGALERVVKTLQTTWQVTASGIADPSEVDEIQAGTAAGLPSVNNSVYSDPTTGQIFPYFFCTSKQVTRDPGNGFVFNVTCDYKDELGDETPQDPPTDPENLCPVVTFGSGEEMSTAWSGKLIPGGDGAIALPTGDLYDQAVLQRVGSLTVSHTQYENAFSEADFRARIMHVNSGDYRGYSAGHAMITGITWSKVLVPIAPSGTFLSNKVQYTISCINKTYLTMDDFGVPTTETAGHHHLRIRSGDRFLLEAGNMDSIVSNSSKHPDAIGPCFLKTDGTRHLEENQGKNASAPPIDQWEVQPRVSFSFLRECP